MLSREQAQAQLKQAQNNMYAKEREAAIAKLPRGLRAIAEPLHAAERTTRFQSLFRSYIPWEHNQKISESEVKARAALVHAVQRLEALKPTDLEKLYYAFFPKFGRQVAAVWELQKSQPYHYHQPFRVPQQPKVTFESRVHWFYQLLTITQSYDRDVAWFAAWTPYLGYGAQVLAPVFAAAMNRKDAEGQEVFDILTASAKGEHEIGAMGHHVVAALLMSSRLEAWSFIENLLLAAQRQEGLRQSILETVHRAHPEAFRRILRVILDNDLTRFSAVTRALDVWLGMAWDVENTRVVRETLAQLLELLESPAEQKRALQSDEPTRVYLALWTVAHADAQKAIEAAVKLLKHKRVEHRFVAAHLLTKIGLEQAYAALLPALRDSDLRVALRAVAPFVQMRVNTFGESDLFERIELLLGRLDPGKKTIPAPVWEWMQIDSDPQHITHALVYALGKRSPLKLLPYLKQMDTWQRASIADLLGAAEKQNGEMRGALLQLMGDAGHHVRERAVRALAKQTITPKEAEQLEALLTRDATDLRRGVLTLLLKQKDAEVLESGQRLWACKHAKQRAAGLELLREMMQAERSVQTCREYVEEFQASDKTVSKRKAGTRAADAAQKEQRVFDELLKPSQTVATLDDALGLSNPEERTKPVAPRSFDTMRARFNGQALVTPAAKKVIAALDALIDEHRATPVMIETHAGAQEQLLGNIKHHFPMPKGDLDREGNLARLPVREALETWERTRDATLRDADGLEFWRALAVLGQRDAYGVKTTRGWQVNVLAALFGGTVECKYQNLVTSLLVWLHWLYPAPNAPDFLLDAVEYTFALIPAEELVYTPKPEERYLRPPWRENTRLGGWLTEARAHRAWHPDQWNDAQITRLYGLLRWMDEPGTQVERHRAYLEEVVSAYQAGGATDADIYDQLLGSRTESPYRRGFKSLQRLTQRKPHPLFNAYLFLKPMVDRACARILELELGRGDLPTAASQPARAIQSLQGIDTIVRLLNALGRDEFVRGWSFDSLSKTVVLSHLVRVSFPAPNDTPETFAQTMREANISERRLVELAMYAPQWALFVERALGWEQFAEGVWWIHAHTKDRLWQVGAEIREAWGAQATERTPLTSADLLEGAVDVAWFQRVYAALGAERWEALYDAAKYASSAIGHARARLFADAMLGRLKREDVVKRIEQKRHQDSVRALGLLPLPTDGTGEQEVMARYRALQEFARGSKKFGSQRQQSEKLAARIAMDNLARTAGYPDPLRLEWAMEAQSNADLENGIAVTRGDVQVTLAVGALGKPTLTVSKEGKELKAIPAALKKDADVVALQARKRELEQQVARMRGSLEEAMCRGDVFTPDELAAFLKHPLLKTLVTQLLFTDDETTGWVKGGGRVLETHAGEQVVLAQDARIRLAHPYDFFKQDVWHEWQRACFLEERVQPFKQVFRELYVMTSIERDANTFSPRYAGNQINNRQALALFGKRGWVAHPEEGVRKTFHAEHLATWVSFRTGWSTPGEVEGWVIENVYFGQRGDWHPLALTQVPPRLFSEVMRDLDLVVSVAHAGGVDPETTASTVEMRAALLRETLALLHLENVELKGNHALIAGKVGNYTVHLGSGVVHQQPGGALCIVPVTAAQRGRIFLPFADDDPKTAEVISKVLLLANDTKIQDPVILEQIVGAR